jgi:hypothetical protein
MTETEDSATGVVPLEANVKLNELIAQDTNEAEGRDCKSSVVDQ